MFWSTTSHSLSSNNEAGNYLADVEGTDVNLNVKSDNVKHQTGLDYEDASEFGEFNVIVDNFQIYNDQVRVFLNETFPDEAKEE
jgi:hypothetical protein